MIEQGDMVKMVGKVNYTDGFTAEVQVDEIKFYLPVSILQKVISEFVFSGFANAIATNPPDLGVSVADGTDLGERLS